MRVSDLIEDFGGILLVVSTQHDPHILLHLSVDAFVRHQAEFSLAKSIGKFLELGIEECYFPAVLLQDKDTLVEAVQDLLVVGAEGDFDGVFVPASFLKEVHEREASELHSGGNNIFFEGF